MAAYDLSKSSDGTVGTFDVPIDVIEWNIIKATGWTPEQIDNMDLARLERYWQIELTQRIAASEK